MTQQSIYISDQGELLLIDAPEKPEQVLQDDYAWRNKWGAIVEKEWADYEAALASAIKEGIKFKDQEEIKKMLCFNPPDKEIEFYVQQLERGQIYPLPTGYKVSFEYQIRSIFGEDNWGNINEETYNDALNNGLSQAHVRKLAILSKLEEEEIDVNDITIKPVYTSEQKLKVVAPSEEVKQGEKQKVYLVMTKQLLIVGCFSTEEKANKYAGGANVMVQEVEVF